MNEAKQLATFDTTAFGGVDAPFYGGGDPLGTFKFFSGAYRPADVLVEGFVVTYNPQTHSASVQIHGSQSLWTCTFADELLSYSFGFSETHPGREGDMVLVYPIDQRRESQSGIIIGRIPFPWNFIVAGDLYGDPDQYHRRLYTQDELAKTTWDRNISCFPMPFANREDDSSHICTHFRPTDVYPGEFAHVNQHNCGIKGGLFSATLLGGGAQLRMSGLSNAARLSCESYMRYSLHAYLHEFHNSRYLSSERNMSLYQEERLGWHSPDGGSCDSNVWTYDSEAPKGGENQTARYRMKDLTGFFGHLSSKFCLRPDPADSKIRVQGDTPKDEGVSRETIDPSGQYRISASGMLTFERTGRIPVPVRICYPTDLGHEIDPRIPEILHPFEHKDNIDIGYRQLELFDRQAYDLRNQYARVDGRGFVPDHYVPQEEDLKPLLDQYDPKFFKNRTVYLTKYDKRRAGMFIGEDGSVIVRDAWGSEIVMLGGNIQLSCAGNVMLLPGHSQLTVAGDDIVQKAQNSIDIHASEHDVRLSAARNMEIVGGGDESDYSGGVVIEARGKIQNGPTPWDGENKGENAKVRGITLRSKNQSVVVDGRYVNLRSRKDTRIVSGDKKIDGYVAVSAKMIRTRADNTLLVGNKPEGGGEASGILIQDKMISAAANTVALLGKKSLVPVEGSKLRVPAMKVSVGNIADDMIQAMKKGTDDLSDEKTASAGFNSEALEKMIFGFRSSRECRTDRTWLVGGRPPFKLYEPSWVQVKDIYETLKNDGVQTKKYDEKAKWENGRPWPGKSAEDTAQYAQLSGLKPINLTGDGFNRSREAVEDNSKIDETPLFSTYLVRADKL